MSGLKNECVCIQLYSKCIPSRKLGLKYDYMVFGHYDGLTVDNNVFEDDSFDLMQLWNNMIKQINLSDEETNFSKQAIYAFRTTNSNDFSEINSGVFWNNKKLPFLFLSIMQLSEIKDYTEFRKQLENRISEKFCNEKTNKKEHLAVIVYYTLETNSILLAIKSKNFIKGENIINSLHQTKSIIEYTDNAGTPHNVEIYNTYTLNAINNEIILNGEYKNIEGEIRNVCLFSIEKFPGSIELLLDNINERLEKRIGIKRNMLTGNDDECLFIKSILWKDLLSLYATENLAEGLLTSGNDIFHMTTYSIATHFMIDANVVNKSFFSNSELAYRATKSTLSISNEIYDFLNILEEEVDKTISNPAFMTATYYKAIRQTINALQKFEISVFPDYTFFQIFIPLKLMSQALLYSACLERKLLEEKDASEQLDFLKKCLKREAVFDFLKGIVLISQNSMHSDRQFMQVPDFNARIYDVPSKLSALYGGIVDKASEILNTTTKNYSFLLVPGLNEYLVVKTVFDSLLDGKRLFTIEIPERQIFATTYTVPTLIHEIAHKVGDKIRMRKERGIIILEIVSVMLTSDILLMYGIAPTKGRHLDNIIAYVRKQMNMCYNNTSKISLEKHNISKRLFNDLVFEELPTQGFSFAERNNNRLSCLQEDLYEAITEFLNFIIGEEDFLNILWKEKADYCREECIPAGREITSRNAFKHNLQMYKTIGETEITGMGVLVGFKITLHYIFYLFSESYADLISIILLNLHSDTYIASIMNNMVDPIQNKLSESISVVRLALVIEQMTINNAKKEQKWDIQQIVNEANNDSPRGRAIKTALELIKIWNVKDYNSKLKIRAIPAVLLRIDIHKKISNYLEECVIMLLRIINEKNDKVLQLRETYKDISSSNINIEKVIERIESSNAEYRNTIFNNHD